MADSRLAARPAEPAGSPAYLAGLPIPVKTVRAGRELRSRCSAHEQTARKKGR